jgi:hypothetical protein
VQLACLNLLTRSSYSRDNFFQKFAAFRVKEVAWLEHLERNRAVSFRRRFPKFQIASTPGLDTAKKDESKQLPADLVATDAHVRGVDRWLVAASCNSIILWCHVIRYRFSRQIFIFAPNYMHTHMPTQEHSRFDLRNVCGRIRETESADHDPGRDGLASRGRKRQENRRCVGGVFCLAFSCGSSRLVRRQIGIGIILVLLALLLLELIIIFGGRVDAMERTQLDDRLPHQVKIRRST